MRPSLVLGWLDPPKVLLTLNFWWRRTLISRLAIPNQATLLVFHVRTWNPVHIDSQVWQNSYLCVRTWNPVHGDSQIRQNLDLRVRTWTPGPHRLPNPAKLWSPCQDMKPGPRGLPNPAKLGSWYTLAPLHHFRVDQYIIAEMCIFSSSPVRKHPGGMGLSDLSVLG